MQPTQNNQARNLSRKSCFFWFDRFLIFDRLFFAERSTEVKGMKNLAQQLSTVYVYAPTTHDRGSVDVYQPAHAQIMQGRYGSVLHVRVCEVISAGVIVV